MQKIRDEKIQAESSIFEEFLAGQQRLRAKLEKQFQEEEAKLKADLLQRVNNVHTAFAEREQRSEGRLAQRCLTSPNKGMKISN